MENRSSKLAKQFGVKILSSIFEQLKKAGLATDKKQKQIQHQKRLEKNNKEQTVNSQPSPPPVSQNIQNTKEFKLNKCYESAEIQDTSGRRKFYFTTHQNIIESLQVSELTAVMLERGKYAIIEKHDNPGTFLIVNKNAALEIESLDKTLIAFLNK